MMTASYLARAASCHALAAVVNKEERTTGRKLFNRSVQRVKVKGAFSSRNSHHQAAKMNSLTGVELVHIARETADVDRLANFYIDILGFKRAHTPDFGPFKVVWLEFPPSLQLHIIERNPESKLPESPLNAGPGSRKDPSALPRGHHLSFRVADYDAAVKSLREKGFEVFEKDQQDHRIKQAFFFDPDGNGLEIGSWPK